MSPLVLAVIAVTVLATSFLSGIFGMAGGLILLGVLLIWLDVAPAMMLFGAIQTTANGSRALLWLRHVQWQIVWRYMIGATTAFVAMRAVSFVPDKATIYLALGILPFAAFLLPRNLAVDISRPYGPYVCGFVILTLQFVAGAAGHILDLFFQQSRLDRRAVVGTKAITQTTGHLMRIAYFGSFASAYDEFDPMVGLCRGRRSCHHGNIAGRPSAGAHDRHALPSVEQARDHGRQRRLSDAWGMVAGEGVSPGIAGRSPHARRCNPWENRHLL